MFIRIVHKECSDDFVDKIKASGGKTKETVSRLLDYLVVGEEAGSKLAEANKLGIKILNEEEFLHDHSTAVIELSHYIQQTLRKLIPPPPPSPEETDTKFELENAKESVSVPVALLSAFLWKGIFFFLALSVITSLMICCTEGA